MRSFLLAKVLVSLAVLEVNVTICNVCSRVLGLGVALVLLACHPTMADAQTDTTVLSKGTDPTWYSVENRTLVPAPPKPRAGINTSDRHNLIDNGGSKAAKEFSWLGDIFRGMLAFIREFYQILLIIVLIAVLCLVVYFLVRIQRLMDSPANKLSGGTRVATQQRKVTDLPFELDRPDLPLLQLVEQYRSQGEFSKAIIYLYSYILIELDAAGLVRLAKGKTNWTYLSELNPRPQEKAFTTSVVYWFEHIFFGKQEMDAAAFESIWTALPSFHEGLSAIRKERN